MRVLLILAVLLAGCGNVDTADVPPAGDIWFGSAFDTETFELSGRTDTVGATETFALVATLPEVMDAGDLNIRASYNGQQVANEAAQGSGSGDVWGFTYGPTFSAGTWTIEITDVGGNVLASGEIEVTE